MAGTDGAVLILQDEHTPRQTLTAMAMQSYVYACSLGHSTNGVRSSPVNGASTRFNDFTQRWLT
jgi:hypothetical protein